MNPQRRALLGGIALTAALPAYSARRKESAADAPTEDAPSWPPAERIALWPGDPPGMPATAPKPALTMNGERGQRQLWVRGVARPEINVFRAPRPDGSALLVIPGGSYEFISVQNEGIVLQPRTVGLAVDYKF